jgi:sugar phosphate isomerase/epimerase
MASSRREFLIQAGTALTTAALIADNPVSLYGNPLNKPIGLQLYSVTEKLEKDFDGTLRQIRAIGYQEVELAGFFGKKPAQFKKSLDDAQLHCASVHIFGDGGPQESMDFAAAIGAKYIISSVTLPENIPAPTGRGGFDDLVKALNKFTLDDFKSIAEHANHLGEQAKKSGLQFGYHNHNFEFRPINGKIGYDEILRLTDPALVKFELDCGWMAAAGHDPAAYLEKYPTRYRLLHIKDFKPTRVPSVGLDSAPTAAELGRGHIDYKPIFAAAKHTAVEYLYVEQEPPFVEVPVMEAIKIDYDYLHSMS